MNLTITNAREKLMQLPEELEGAVTITRHGQPVLALMPWTIYQEMLETVEILGDPEIVESLKRSIVHASHGNVPLLERVVTDLGLV
jgi:antitoxin YefM